MEQQLEIPRQVIMMAIGASEEPYAEKADESAKKLLEHYRRSVQNDLIIYRREKSDTPLARAILRNIAQKHFSRPTAPP